MRGLCIAVSVTVFSAIGWWLGAKIGFVTAYFVSGAGSLVGVYVGWRIYRDYLE